MTNKQQSNVRLVKCPRCAKILPEPEHVPLYACGGCGTTLQAKNYRDSRKNTTLSSHEKNFKKSNGIIQAHNGGESSSSSRRSSSASEQLSVQEKGRDQETVEKLGDSEQNGAADSSEHTLLSKESSFLKKNGQADSKMDQFVLKDRNERRDREAAQSSEQNGAASSVNHIAISQESSLIEDKENGEIDSKLDQVVLKDQNEGKYQDSVKRLSKSEQNEAANAAHHSALSEEPHFTKKMDLLDSKDQVPNNNPTVLENKQLEQLNMGNSVLEDNNGQDEQCDGIVENHHEKQIGDVNHDKDTFTPEDSQVLGKKDGKSLAVVRDSMEDEDDQHDQKKVGYVSSAEDTSSLIESPAIQNPAKYQVSDHQLPEETRKMHLRGKYSHQDQHKQKQIGFEISAKNASSLIESPTIKNLEEHGASECEVSKDTRTMHVAGEHPHDDEHKQKQAGYASSAQDTSSITESSALKKPIQLNSENSADYNAFDHEMSKEIRKVHNVGKLSHQDASENEITCLEAEKSEVQKSGKKYGNGTGPNDFVECIAERLENVKLSSAPSHSAEINQGGNADSVSGTEDGLEAYGSHSVSVPSNVTDLKISHDKSTTKVSRDTHHEKKSLDNTKGSSKKIIKNFKDSDVYSDGEFGSLLKEIPRSPTKRSPAYDGSVSSFDGNDDQVPGQPVQMGERTLPTFNDGAEDSPERENVISERKIYRNSRVQTQARSSSTMLSDQKLKSSMVEEDGPLEENGIPPRNNRIRPDRDSFLPRVPYSRRSCELVYETGSSSSYALRDEPLSHQMHHHPYRGRFPEVPVYREKEFPPKYYNSETSGEIYDRTKYQHAYIDRRRRSESWSQSGTLPRMPYSGEIFDGRYPYMHRYPDDQRWSAQLPPPAVCCHQGVCMGPTWGNRWDPYDSYPSSPQRFVESESSCGWGHETMYQSDDHRQKDQVMRRLYLREKRQAVKRRYHPIAGGAPFLTCYFCLNVLQLPEGFLHSRRRRGKINHKLQCGACSRILKVSLENEGCIAPSEACVDKNVNLAASSHVNHSRRGSLNSADGRDLLSRDTFGTSGREKRKVIPGSSRNRERMEDSDDAAPHATRGRESKVTWKMPARSKSPLHRLMGYSSPQDLLTGREDEDDVE
ncbi:protein ENHANCED DISEASE RESISTANCE 4-like isoform X3 [Chenopodium quinoa]|uniref:protein ENHANCED DISEASE RESISTANCE 4-like isoform X2 n=1 Tax=Chenopodium quinoa TaxID=63459 RepID=UPI000B790F00|nr:protein ENHANCED DISEASE RESISTANCE 4-like isoform X2 [Chenopodium quinoa]XP_021737916.1 protein ENHANCED DISEASE RESISTANCE 4-like isoform X3 [Chenopodium quinoa]